MYASVTSIAQESPHTQQFKGSNLVYCLISHDLCIATLSREVMNKHAFISASCCLCISVSPTLPKNTIYIHTLSHLDETVTVQSKSVDSFKPTLSAAKPRLELRCAVSSQLHQRQKGSYLFLKKQQQLNAPPNHPKPPQTPKILLKSLKLNIYVGERDGSHE